mgnify:CR=1 FL=1
MTQPQTRDPHGPHFRLTDERLASLRANIGNVLRDAGADTTDRLIAIVIATAMQEARDAHKAGYEACQRRYVPTMGEPNADGVRLGTIDLAQVAADAVAEIDDLLNVNDGDVVEAAAFVAKMLAQFMELRAGVIATGLRQEHDRLARIAASYPALTSGVRAACEAYRSAIAFVEGGGLPVELLPLPEPTPEPVPPTRKVTP